MEKGTSQFFRSAGRCGAMRHGVHAGMPLGCPLPACSWGNNLIFQKTLIFRKSLQICGQGMHPRPRHASKAKAKACSEGQGQGSPLWACCPRPGHAAAKAKAAPMGRQRRPRHACVHAAKAKARSQGHGMVAWARWHAPGCRQVGTLACPWAQAAARP